MLASVACLVRWDDLMDARSLRWRVRCLLAIFVAGLVVSGLTAFPLVWEIGLVHRFVGPGTMVERWWPAMSQWITTVRQGLMETNAKYPFLFYGTDWLAFAHTVIAVAFLGPLRDPVRNVWVIEFGMIACVLLIANALICGPLRGIPGFWRMIDCSFGVIGIIPLWLARIYVKRLIALQGRPGTAG
jgi:hypothetical protein